MADPNVNSGQATPANTTSSSINPNALGSLIKEATQVSSFGENPMSFIQKAF